MFEDAEANAAAIDAITAARARSHHRPEHVRTWPSVPGMNSGGAGGARTRPTTRRVFVLTHHPRKPLVMEGGTTSTFVTDGLESALARAREAACDGDVSIAGGAQTINQFLSIGAIEELRLHVAPVLLHSGERLFDGAGELTLEPLAVSGTDLVTHLSYRVRR